MGRGVNQRVRSTGSATARDLDLVVDIQRHQINTDSLLSICRLRLQQSQTPAKLHWPQWCQFISRHAGGGGGGGRLRCGTRPVDSLSLSHLLTSSVVYVDLCIVTLWLCGKGSQSSRLINVMFGHISTRLRRQSICGKERQ